MVVGATGTGKSTIIQTIFTATNQIYKQNQKNQKFDENFRLTKMQKVNPKSVSINYLYGYINLLTNEWNDGIAAKIIRDAIDESSEEQQCMIFDGPVDTLWVENLNTVFDDNKTLCLSNGQRIKIQQNFKIIFEVSDLDQASPATVSRCGMIYVDSNQLGWKPIVNQWYGNFVVEHLSKKTNSKVES